MVEIERPEAGTPYIVLESILGDKNSMRIVHTIMIKDNQMDFKIGRGHESDLRINDISVSRLHVIIKYKDGGFFL